MARIMLFWNMDGSRIPEDPKVRGTGWNKLLGGVKQDLERGLMKEWGSFIGESAGYCVMEGDDVEISTALQRYIPYVKFTGHPVMNVRETEDMLRQLTK